MFNFEELSINIEEVFKARKALTRQGYILFDMGFKEDVFIEEYINLNGEAAHIMYRKNINPSNEVFKDLIIKTSIAKFKINRSLLNYRDITFSIGVHSAKTQEDFNKVMSSYISRVAGSNIQSLFSEKTLSILTNAYISIVYDNFNIYFMYGGFLYSVRAFNTDLFKVLQYKNSLAYAA